MADNRFPPGGYYGSGVPEYGQGSDSAVELMHLIDSLEALVGAAVRIPWINKVLLDREELLDVIDQMRVSLPDGMQDVRAAHQDIEEMREQARAEAEEIKRRAQEEAYLRLSETDQVRAAQTLARDIIVRARDDAEAIKRDADTYALEVLTRLERDLNSQLNTIRGGVRTLQTATRNGAHPPDDHSPDGR